MGRRMRGIELALTRSVGEALNAAGRDYRKVSVLLRRLERSQIAQLQGNQRLIQEARRRIAELLLWNALRHGCSFEVCRTRLNNLCKLGFSRIESKSTYYLLYARGAMERGHRAVARKIATTMKSELERYLQRRKSLAGEEDLKLIRSFLAKLDRSN